MEPLRKNPHLYEINLMPWLTHVCGKEQRPITLKNIPPSVWSELKDKGMDLVWLMGIWHRSRDACKRARNTSDLLEYCRLRFKDFKTEDIAGSPYAIERYLPDPVFGNRQDLLSLKDLLADMGLRLVLDFVPNHTARDHDWIKEHPEYYVQADLTKKGRCPKGFFPSEHPSAMPCIAHGKDPSFPAWTDTAQVNYGNAEAVSAMRDTLFIISRFCHGLRCDMAMLVLKKIFFKTWRRCTKDAADGEFWRLAMDGLRSTSSRCIMIAEVYWGMEQKLLELGFDYAYDKVFYDLLVAEDIQGLSAHLSAPVGRQERMVRFLENHDESRAMDVFGPEKIFSAMVIHATVPGMRFWHHGQFEGNRIRVPVQLGRVEEEPVNRELQTFSERLLHEVNHPVFHDGIWKMCEIEGWPDNPSYRNLLAWCWRKETERRLIVVNYSSGPAQGLVRMPVNWLPEKDRFICHDPLKGETYERSTAQVEASGLYVELGKWDYHFFRIS